LHYIARMHLHVSYYVLKQLSHLKHHELLAVPETLPLAMLCQPTSWADAFNVAHYHFQQGSIGKDLEAP
jgi:hypothetical protein